MRKLLTLLIALAAVVGVTASSFGRSMILMDGVGTTAAAAPSGPIAFTYQSSGNPGNTGGVYTSSAQGIGTASANRIVYVVLLSNGSPGGNTLTSATIGGVNPDGLSGLARAPQRAGLA